jgi:hypothetical protein
MKYIIRFKFIYITLIVANLVLTLVWLGNVSEGRTAFPYLYLIPWQSIAGLILLTNTSLFLIVHIFLLSKILNKKLTPKLYRLEQVLSIGRMLMVLSIVVPIFDSVMILYGPVGRSFWLPLIGLLPFVAILLWIFPFGIILFLPLEFGYISRLSSYKDQLKEGLLPDQNGEAASVPAKKESWFREFMDAFGKHRSIKVVTVPAVFSLIGIFLLLQVWIFGMPGSPLIIKEVKVWAKNLHSRGYLLKIPGLYIAPPKRNVFKIPNKYKLKLKVPYPAMWISSSDKEQLESLATSGKDQNWVDITVKHNFYPGHLETGVNPRNDNGRFILKNIKRSSAHKEVPVSRSIKNSDKVIKIKLLGERTKELIYVVTHEDQRIALIQCDFMVICDVKTTWAGELAVKYKVDRTQLVDIVDLDRSIVKLIDSFAPELIEKGH